MFGGWIATGLAVANDYWKKSSLQGTVIVSNRLYETCGMLVARTVLERPTAKIFNPCWLCQVGSKLK